MKKRPRSVIIHEDYEEYVQSHLQEDSASSTQMSAQYVNIPDHFRVSESAAERGRARNTPQDIISSGNDETTVDDSGYPEAYRNTGARPKVRKHTRIRSKPSDTDMAINFNYARQRHDGHPTQYPNHYEQIHSRHSKHKKPKKDRKKVVGFFKGMFPRKKKLQNVSNNTYRQYEAVEEDGTYQEITPADIDTFSDDGYLRPTNHYDISDDAVYHPLPSNSDNLEFQTFRNRSDEVGNGSAQSDVQ